MKEPTCCNNSNWDLDQTDLGHKGSFEFMLGRCSNCGTYWLNVFCVATNTTGYERISDDDVRIMLNMPWGSERNAFVYKWFLEN
jgi:hypothetical protein